jgi:hypothetical protein
MNKLLVILLFIPLFADAQIGMLLRPLEEEETGGGPSMPAPNEISDLAVWIRADTLVTLSGSTITDLKEIVSGTSANAILGSPQLSGDHIVFSATGSYIYWFSLSPTLNGSAITYVIVYDPGNNNEFVLAGNGSTAFSTVKPTGGYSELDASFGTLEGNITFSSGWTDKSVVVIRAPAPKTTSTVELRVNDTDIGVSSTTGSSAIDEPLNTIAIGVGYDYTGSATPKFAQGDFYELIIYDRELTSTEEDNLVQYLYNRYSITP